MTSYKSSSLNSIKLSYIIAEVSAKYWFSLQIYFLIPSLVSLFNHFTCSSFLLPLITPLKLIENLQTYQIISRQKLYRFINCVELVSPHHAARELVHTLRKGHITSLFQKSVKRVRWKWRLTCVNVFKVLICFRRKMNSADVERVRRSSLRWFRKYGGEIDLRFYHEHI